MNEKPQSRPPRALVTGGNGNLGQQVALLLASAGFEVHVTVRDEAARTSLAHSTEHGATIHVGDLSREADVKRVFEETGAPLAALVATVGGFHGGAFADIDEAAIDFQYLLNLKSSILTLRYAYPALAAHPGGSAAVLIANRPSLSSGPGTAVTTAMKAGIVSLVKSVADEWKLQGIRVNAVAPGLMDTPENRRAMPDADPSQWPTPTQVAGVIAYLVSDAASIITGTVVPVFGRG